MSVRKNQQIKSSFLDDDYLTQSTYLQQFRRDPTYIVPFLIQRMARYKNYEGVQYLFSKKCQKKAVEVQQKQTQSRIKQLIEILNKETTKMKELIPIKMLNKIAYNLCKIIQPRIASQIKFKPETSKILRNSLDKDQKWSYPNSVSCLISLGLDEPYQSLMNLLIDDGLKSRANRKNLLNSNFKYFGLSSIKSKTQEGLKCTVYIFTDTIVQKIINTNQPSLPAVNMLNQTKKSSEQLQRQNNKNSNDLNQSNYSKGRNSQHKYNQIKNVYSTQSNQENYHKINKINQKQRLDNNQNKFNNYESIHPMQNRQKLNNQNIITNQVSNINYFYQTKQPYINQIKEVSTHPTKSQKAHKNSEKPIELVNKSQPNNQTQRFTKQVDQKNYNSHQKNLKNHNEQNLQQKYQSNYNIRNTIQNTGKTSLQQQDIYFPFSAIKVNRNNA